MATSLRIRYPNQTLPSLLRMKGHPDRLNGFAHAVIESERAFVA
jgi:hypothetical protein